LEDFFQNANDSLPGLEGCDTDGLFLITRTNELQMAFRRKIYRSIEELQIDLDDWQHPCNHDRTPQAKMCCGRTPIKR
jgi:hypothetical protein